MFSDGFIKEWPVLKQIRTGDWRGTGETAMSSQTENLAPRFQDAQIARSICPYCGVGCGQLIYHKNNEIIQIEGDPCSSVLETFEGYDVAFKRDPVINRPLKCGFSGWMTRAGGVLSGPVPLALRLAALVMRRRAPKLRRIAACYGIAGSILTRYGWVYAGHASARDWRVPLEVKQAGSQLQLRPDTTKASRRPSAETLLEKTC